jgi:poly(3-hydroxybutyrate) depolymerase
MAVNSPPTTFEEIAFTDAVTAFGAAVDGVAEFWAGALRRRATPLELAGDCARWWDLLAQRGRPSWSTLHEIVFEAPIARLRDFSPADASASVIPTLVLPPQAGHDSCIVDFSAAQSQMRTILAAGLTRAYALDWIGATHATRNVGVEDYLQVIARSIEHLGGRVNLIGDCQGGWLATIYAALHPEQINTLTIAGAPIDFHSGEPVIHAAVQSFAPGGDLAFYRGLVAAGGGMLSGDTMLTGFIAIQPDNEIGRQFALLAHVNDRAHVERYQEFEDWFKHTQAIPGAFYLWIVEHLFRDNQLISGQLEIGGRSVDVSQIRCPLNLLAGATDHITPPPQVFALADYAGTPPGDVLHDTTAGGHLGLFMGHEALHEHWPPILAAVHERSV